MKDIRTKLLSAATTVARKDDTSLQAVRNIVLGLGDDGHRRIPWYLTFRQIPDKSVRSRSNVASVYCFTEGANLMGT